MDGNILVLGGVAPISLPQDEGGGGGGGGEAVLIDKTITANGTYRASADGADGFKKVVVNVSASPDLQSKTVTISENGTTTVTPDTGKDGLSSVLIDVDVSPVLQSKSVSITSNGTTTVSPDSGKDGLSSVTVTANVNPPLISEERTITANGSTTVMPPSGAYGLSAVLINTAVSNSYAAADEGKVVSGGALVAQTAATYNNNGTYDTTTISSVTVNVSGGGPDPNHIDTGATAHIFSGMTDWVSSRATWSTSGNNASNRRTVFMSSGTQEVKNNSGVGTGWYLIPIPSGATTVTVTVDRTLQFAIREFIESGGVITGSVATTGWTNITADVGAATVLTSGTSYLGVSFRVDSSNPSFNIATTQPYRVQLDFS